MKIQFFLRGERDPVTGLKDFSHHSEIHENGSKDWLDRDAMEDWDGALIEEDGVRTYYASNGCPPFWRCLEEGDDCGVEFIEDK